MMVEVVSNSFIKKLTPKLGPITKNYQNFMASLKTADVDLITFRSC